MRSGTSSTATRRATRPMTAPARASTTRPGPMPTMSGASTRTTRPGSGSAAAWAPTSTSTASPTRTPGQGRSATPVRTLRSTRRQSGSPARCSTAGRTTSRVAFEADLPRIEGSTNPPCQRFISNPARSEPGQRMREPAGRRELLPVLLHHLGARAMRVAAGRAVHSGHDERVRRQLGRRVRAVAVAGLPGG